MKKILLAGAALVAMTVAASAADLPRRTAPVVPAYIPPVFTWTGFYAGLNAGAAFNGDSNLKDVSINGYNYGNGYFTTKRNSDEGSFTGGAQIGYNYQIGSVVFGLETDFNYAGVDKKYYANNLVSNIAAKSRTEWFGTLRPRIGFTPMDRLLVYVTGGLAYGQVSSSGAYVNSSTGFELSGSKDSTRAGWTLGGGLEYAFTNNVTVRGEYAYVNLGDKNHRVTDSAGDEIVWKDPASFHLVRVGVNYKF